MSRLNTQLFLFSTLVFCSADALAFGWDDLWKTTDQQVDELIELESYDEAANRADSPEQKALIKFRAGDFESSAEMYGQSSENYNHGTALARAGDYTAAIEAYDQILADSDEYKDAMHNRKVAQKLAELQKQQQEQQGGGEGSGEQGQPPPPGEPSDSKGQPGDPSDSEPGEQNQDSPPSDGQGDESDRPPEQEPADGEPSPASGDAEEGDESKGQPEAESHDEKRQAMEQLLLRVPDDPAGLLKARIIREHQRNYANSQDREQAW